jgi:hypothetical protein
MSAGQARKLVELIRKSGAESSVAMLQTFGMFKIEPLPKPKYYWQFIELKRMRELDPESPKI